MTRRPLKVTVWWDDAADRHETCDWDGTFETALKIAEKVTPYRDRETTANLGLVTAEWVYLASDYDHEDGELSKWSVIPLGWVTKIAIANGRVLFTREQAVLKPKKPKAPLKKE